ncbi:Putative syntaxin-24 [Apostasia shenzhenica]|uniref:Syntaxin-24 n=1 Tax=Apostasia shenzhenica TaxID=1088818 RepID=A0A2I0A815_9ASPA|nr:Putative syntaxin-24 [Apostasia shenzhenica]
MEVNRPHYDRLAPPPEKSQHAGGEDSGFCCFVFTLLKIAASIFLILFIIAIILWFVVNPKDVKVNVEDAALTQFNLAGNNLLHYNLTVAVRLRNPNEKLGVYYDSVEARAVYNGSRFGSTNLPVFFQGHVNTTILRPAFQGSGFPLGEAAAETFEMEKATGIYNIDVQLRVKIRIKAGFLKIPAKKEFDCWLKAPVPAGEVSSPAPANLIPRTECAADYLWYMFWKYWRKD